MERNSTSCGDGKIVDQMDFFGGQAEQASNEASGESVNPQAVAHRVRTLLLTAPIHALERNKLLRRPDMRNLDVRSLALIALDLAIEGMGFDDGISKPDLIQHPAG